MIPPFPGRGEQLRDIPPATEEEVFMGQDTLGSVFEDQHMHPIAMAGLWRTLERNSGVHLDDEGQVDDIRRGGLYCIRTLGSLPLVSVDGLVDGLVSQELLGPGVKKLGEQRLADIAYIGMVLTPDRTDEISTAMNKRKILRYYPESKKRLDYLLSEKGC